MFRFTFAQIFSLEIKTICVCGAGTMGRGIAQAAAQYGFQVILYELNAGVLEKASSAIEKQLGIMTSKGRLAPGEQELVMARLTFTSKLEECKADVIIEAIIEEPRAKVGLFNHLAEINGSTSIYATNTSSLSIGEIARDFICPDKMIGMHFFNPAPVMKLVEVVKTDKTDEMVINQTMELARKMGKTPVLCRDSPGFIVNRVARPYYIESLRLVEEGVSDFEKIDAIMESSGFRMGPFRLMDLIGNDVNFAVSNSVYEQLGRPERLRPSAIQGSKVDEGALGRKSGRGYYQYDANGNTLER